MSGCPGTTGRRRPCRPRQVGDAPTQGVGPADSSFRLPAIGRGQRPHGAGPVEIVAEYENWRKIRDWQGASGWVHQSLLTGKRSFIIASKAASLHKTPASSAEVVAKLEPEVMGEIRSCAGDWCRVKVSSVSGWIERTGMWGVYKSEPIN